MFSTVDKVNRPNMIHKETATVDGLSKHHQKSDRESCQFTRAHIQHSAKYICTVCDCEHIVSIMFPSPSLHSIAWISKNTCVLFINDRDLQNRHIYSTEYSHHQNYILQFTRSTVNIQINVCVSQSTTSAAQLCSINIANSINIIIAKTKNSINVDIA